MPQQVLNLLEQSTHPRVEYTNYGFYITVQNSSIGKDRRVYCQPAMIAHSNIYDASFNVFLENNELTLEIFPWDGQSLPADFRESDVRLVGTVENRE